ncbi:Uma2 family endonuclease, partial [Streptomyces sp. NPDC054771]
MHYATAGVPVYLIVDPCTGTWHLHTLPKEDEYRRVLSLDFGTPVDLTSTVVGLTLETGDSPATDAPGPPARRYMARPRPVLT